MVSTNRFLSLSLSPLFHAWYCCHACFSFLLCLWFYWRHLYYTRIYRGFKATFLNLNPSSASSSDFNFFMILFYTFGGGALKNIPLADVAQWIECWPANQRVAGSIPSQGTCLGCGPGPQLGT